jgi:hypothetical protein
MPAREMLLNLACVVTGLGVCLAGALLFSTGYTAHAVCGGTLFALGAAGVGLQGWHAVKRLRADRGNNVYIMLTAGTSGRRLPAWGGGLPLSRCTAGPGVLS